MEERTYGSPAVVGLVRQLVEEERNESILPDDDPRKAELQALDLLGYEHNIVAEALKDIPRWSVEDAVKVLQAGGWL